MKSVKIFMTRLQQTAKMRRIKIRVRMFHDTFVDDLFHFSRYINVNRRNPISAMQVDHYRNDISVAGGANSY